MFKRNLYASLMIVTLAGLNSCSGGSEKKNVNKHAATEAETPVAVTVLASAETMQPVILASGEVEAVQTAHISTRVMGRITGIFVKTGDRVHKGQLLARVWDEDIRAKRAQADAMIAEAESAYTTAQKDYDRFSKLFEQQSATAKELDNVTQQYNSARARMIAAKQMKGEITAVLSNSSLVAPFSGVVTQKLAEVGSLASPGMPILTIEQDGDLQVSAAIAETDITNIHLGDMAGIQIKSTGKRYDGKIIQINPSSQFTGGQYIIKISIPEESGNDIYAGMFAQVSIPVKDTERLKNGAILVPLSAIINRDELTGIYTISADNTALLRWIRLGKTYGDKVEVISGLSRDEKFIHSADSRLSNGVPVVVKGITKVSNVSSRDIYGDY